MPERSLGIWAEEPGVLESGIEETSQREAIEEVVEEDSRGAARLTISKIDIFDNSEHALLTLAADRADILKVQRFQSYLEQIELPTKMFFRWILKTLLKLLKSLEYLSLDRSRTTSFEYDFLWEKLSDPRGGYLKIKG